MDSKNKSFLDVPLMAGLGGSWMFLPEMLSALRKFGSVSA
jgi:hypothetical protein